MKKYDEHLITAFLTSFKPAEIMRIAGIGNTKYYSLKNDPEFQKILTERRDLLIKEAVLKMENYLSEDVEILQGIIRNPETKDQIKINAIQLIMNQLGQWKQITELIQRIEALEAVNGQNTSV